MRDIEKCRYSVEAKEWSKVYRRRGMKGYITDAGYMGWWQGEYVLFASEADYREMMEEKI